MIGQSTVATLILGFILSGTAHAAELFSPPMTPGDDVNSLACSITNVGDDPREVTIEIFGFKSPGAGGIGDGDLLGTFGPSSLSPLNTFTGVVPDTSAPNITPHICKFTVQGKKAGYRASACVIPTGGLGDPLACVPAD